MTRIEKFLSSIARRSERSEIRECLKLTRKEGMISFAGGWPSPETFPIEDLKEIVCGIFEKDGTFALQYGKTEGEDSLRNVLKQRYQNKGFNIEKENVMVTTSSQQALDFIGKIFIDEGDVVICELPSYSGALGAFKKYGADLVGVETDDDGVVLEHLKSQIENVKKEGKKIKYMYLIPDFQNPKGVTTSLERRKGVVEIAKEHDILIVEDCPYRDIIFEGEPVKSFYELDSKRVIHLGSFSKVFIPAMRTGWIISDQEIISVFITEKQTADLCTSELLQKIASTYLQKGLYDKNLIKLIDFYREKRDVMLKALDDYMPEYVEWTKPKGGLFLFVTLPDHMDSDELFKKALGKNVAFILGRVFYCDGGGRNTLRLNFSFMNKEDIKEGVKRLSEVIRDFD